MYIPLAPHNIPTLPASNVIVRIPVNPAAVNRKKSRARVMKKNCKVRLNLSVPITIPTVSNPPHE